MYTSIKTSLARDSLRLPHISVQDVHNPVSFLWIAQKLDGQDVKQELVCL